MTEALRKHRGTVLEGANAIYAKIRENPSALALYHGLTRAQADRVIAENMREIPVEWPHPWMLAFGATRSGKSYTDAFKKVMACLRFPNWKGLIIRKRHEQLRNTWLATLHEVCGKITGDNPDWLILDERENAGAIEVDMASQTGKPGKLIIRIEPEGAPSDIENSLRGYTLDGFTMEEATELSEHSPPLLVTRCSKPSRNGETHGTIISNPPRSDRHWLPKLAQASETEALSGKQPFWRVIRSKTEDAVGVMGRDYLRMLEKLYERDPVGYQTMVLGLNGTGQDGEPVYGHVFDIRKHVSADISFNPYLPLVRGWDFGRSAGCTFLQVTKEGHVRVLAELLVEQHYVEEFVDEVEALTERMFSDRLSAIEDWGDIAGATETDKGSSIRRVSEYTNGRINIQSQYLGEVNIRVKHLCRIMSLSRNKAECFLIHPRCPELIRGFRGGYYRKINQSGIVGKSPFKDGVIDHIMDSCSYGICGVLPPHVIDRDPDGEDNDQTQMRAVRGRTIEVPT